MTSYMSVALHQAGLAFSNGEIPVGAVAVKNGTILASGHNMRETARCVSRHAEMIVLEKVCHALNEWRTQDVDVYVTLEPCAMCASAMIDAQIRRLYFGCYDLVQGACGSMVDLFPLRHSKIEVYGGIMEVECEQIMMDFFKQLRSEK